MPKSQNITWWQVNNIVPIVVTFVGMAFSFAMWTSRISVLETKMDLVLEQQKQILAKYSGVETRYGELSLKVKELETIVVRR